MYISEVVGGTIHKLLNFTSANIQVCQVVLILSLFWLPFKIRRVNTRNLTISCAHTCVHAQVYLDMFSVFTSFQFFLCRSSDVRFWNANKFWKISSFGFANSWVLGNCNMNILICPDLDLQTRDKCVRVHVNTISALDSRSTNLSREIVVFESRFQVRSSQFHKCNKRVVKGFMFTDR